MGTPNVLRSPAYFTASSDLQPRGVPAQPTCRLDLRCHVGNFELNSLVLADGHAKRFALAGIFHGFFKRSTRDAGRQHACSRAGTIEDTHRDLERVSLLCQ